MRSSLYVLQSSPLGTFGVVWQDAESPLVQRVFLPAERALVERLVRSAFRDARPGSCPEMAELGRRIRGFLQGDAIVLDLDQCAFDRCSEFQQGVLRAEAQVPRSCVTTYGRIAHQLGIPGGARAVGGALARNPFPLIVPCHRAVRADGQLGGFQGGTEMKRALLELEGVEFSAAGGVLMRRVHY